MNQPGIQWKVRDPVFFLWLAWEMGRCFACGSLWVLLRGRQEQQGSFEACLGTGQLGMDIRLGWYFIQNYSIGTCWWPFYFWARSWKTESNSQFTVSGISSYLHYLHQHSPSVPMLVWKNGFDRHFLVFFAWWPFSRSKRIDEYCSRNNYALIASTETQEIGRWKSGGLLSKVECG